MSFTKTLAHWLPPVLLIAIIAWLYYSFIIEFCLHYLQSPARKYCYIIFGHVLVIMFFWSYFTTFGQDHDMVPNEYKLSREHHNKLITYDNDHIEMILRKIVEMRQLQILTKTDSGQIRYCKVCRQIKPDRAHHCSTCEICVLKMDHHCPWVGNCVGFYNHKQFILMLMYGTVLCLVFVGTVLEFVHDFWTDMEENLRKLHVTIGFVLAVLLGTFVALLFGYNFNQVLHNETTLEALRSPMFENDTVTFNLGAYNNFVETFGNLSCLWLIPVHSALGNGYEFPTARIAPV